MNRGGLEAGEDLEEETEVDAEDTSTRDHLQVHTSNKTSF